MHARVLEHVEVKSNFSDAVLVYLCVSLGDWTQFTRRGCQGLYLLSSLAQVWESRAETWHMVNLLRPLQLLCRWGLLQEVTRVKAGKTLRSLQRSKSWWRLAGEIMFAVIGNTMCGLSFGKRDRAWVEDKVRWKTDGSEWLGRLATGVFCVDCGALCLNDKNLGGEATRAGKLMNPVLEGWRWRELCTCRGCFLFFLFLKF